MPTFSSANDFPVAPALLFDFLLRTANLMKISPPELNSRLLQGPDRIQLGDRVRVETRYLGMRQTITMQVIALDPERVLTDEQVEGPFRSLKHERLFEPIAEGTRLSETIEYEPPGGLVGMLLTPARIEKYMADMFAFRIAALRKLLSPEGRP